MSKGAIQAIVVLALAAGAVAAYLMMGGYLAGEEGGATFVVPYDPGIDITAGDRTFELGDATVLVTLQPRPPKPFEPLSWRLTFLRDGQPLAVEDPELTFNMQMDMGRHAYDLIPAGDGYTAKTVLPKCMKGGKRWYARLRFRLDGRDHETVFLFDMAS